MHAHVEFWHESIKANFKSKWETWIYTVYGNGMYSSYLAYTSKIQCSLLVHYFNDKSPMFSHFIFSKLTMKFYGIWYNV